MKFQPPDRNYKKDLPNLQNCLNMNTCMIYLPFSIMKHQMMISTILCEKCLYSELFWSAFSCIRTEYGEIFRISPYFVRMWENADQNNSEYKHFLRSSN